MDSLAPVARAHYGGAGLLAKVRTALSELCAEGTRIYVHELATLDHFHTRGVLATRDLADAMEIEPGMSVLDLGCGIGGPARYIAANYGANVTGIDLSPAFIETAQYLSWRCDLRDRTTFMVGDALNPYVPDASFDRVLLQHVAMNIADRSALYRSISRVLKPGGKVGIYDIVARARDPHFPLPWATSTEGSHLLTEAETRMLLIDHFAIESWRNDTDLVAQWFAAKHGQAPSRGLSLTAMLGSGYREMTQNLARSLREGRLGVIMAVARRTAPSPQQQGSPDAIRIA